MLALPHLIPSAPNRGGGHPLPTQYDAVRVSLMFASVALCSLRFLLTLPRVQFQGNLGLPYAVRFRIGALYRLISSELLTTETELNAIAAPAIIGFSRKPVNGNSTPAATGMVITL